MPAVAQIVGADRILFASDYGLLRQRRVIDYIRQSGLSAPAVEMVLGGKRQSLAWPVRNEFIASAYAIIADTRENNNASYLFREWE